MNRRSFIIAAAGATASPVVAVASQGHDEFRELVQAAIDGDEAYNADPLAGELNGPVGEAYEDALIARTYGPPFKRICAGNLPSPKTPAAAALGLRYTLANIASLDPADEAIVRAVLAFLERGENWHVSA